MGVQSRAPGNEVDPAIHVRGLVKTFDHGRTMALAGVDLDIAQGEFVAVTGPSASGKSTLLHLLAALDRPDAGRIVVGGVDLGGRMDRDRYRGTVVGIVFQLDHLLPVLTAAENIEAALVGAKMSGRERRRRAHAVLTDVGLGDIAGRRPPTLSGGQRQRLAIARALAMNPSILLADEPTGRLDQANGQNLMRLIGRLRRERDLTVLLVTHDPAISEWADRSLELVDGRITEPPPGDACSSCPSYRLRGTGFCGRCGSALLTVPAPIVDSDRAVP